MRGLNDPQKSQHKSALAAACSTHDSDLFSSSHREAKPFQNIAQLRFVPQRIILEYKFSSGKDLFIIVDLLERLVFDPVVLQVPDVTGFRVETSQLFAFSQ